ncbi:MAG: site-specific integrase [Oligoflexales bacterium]|nr:site-specific integrase [Oligoflexales bacterium]
MLWRPISAYYKKTSAGNHEVRWRDHKGREKQKTFRTKPEATAWMEYLRCGVHPEHAMEDAGHNITVRGFLEIFKERHCAMKSAGTKRHYIQSLETHVFPYIGDKPMSEVDDDDIRLWMKKLAGKKVSAKSLCNHRRLVHLYFKCACIWKFQDQLGNRKPFIKYNPVTYTTNPLSIEEHEIVTWTDAEKRAFLSYVKDKDSLAYEVTCLALNTGLRRGEIAALRLEHINFENKVITVKESFCYTSLQAKHTKSRRIRYIPMNDDVVSLLQEKRNSPSYKTIFHRNHIQKFSSRLKYWCVKSGVTPIGIHGLRHTFATSLVRAGVDVKRVQVLLGHSDITTTMRYVHLVNLDLSGVTKCIEMGAVKE